MAKRFGKRMIRGLLKGIAWGGVLFILTKILCEAVNVMMQNPILPADGLATLTLALGAFAKMSEEAEEEAEEG